MPIVIIVALIAWFGHRSSKEITGRMGGIMAFGRSKAKVYDEDRPKTRFADIAGYEGSKAEVMEVVDFLKHPGRRGRPQGRADGRAAGDRQNPAGPGCRWRGRRAVLRLERLQFRRDVRRRRRDSCYE